MEKFDAKSLVKLAQACRKAGIKQFKGFGMEFTLTDEVPSKSTKRQATKAAVHHGEQGEVETDEPSAEQLLMWSAQGLPDELNPNEASS